MKPFLITLAAGLLCLHAAPIDAGALNVKTAAPQTAATVPMGSYLGTYTYPATHRYTLSANVDGFVTAIAVKPYARVKKEQVLLVLKSPKLLDLQSDYIATQLEREFYRKEIERLAPLAEKGVVASKRYLESKNQYDKLTASAAFKRDVLAAYGMTDTKLDAIAVNRKPDPVLAVKAPADASVAELSVQSGSFVAQGEVLARLVDTSECHFEVDMPWQLAATLQQGETLYSDTGTFTIFAMAPQIDSASQTRGIDLHEAGDCGGRGGATANVTLYRKQSAWKVPASAVVGTETGHALFVAAAGGFTMVPVTVLAQLEGLSFVAGDLHETDRVAVSSVLALKSAAEGSDE